jgi:hypothetical protein
MMPAIRCAFRFTIAAALLLALAGWVRSYFAIDALHWTNSNRFISCLSSNGRLNLTERVWPHGTAWEAGWTVTSISRSDPTRLPLWETDPDIFGRRRFLGFEWSENLSPWPSNQSSFDSFFLPTYRLIAVPYWAIGMLLALPLVRPVVQGARRRARLQRGQCPQCAYDLRGTPAGCPECGWSPPSSDAAASAAAPIVPM